MLSEELLLIDADPADDEVGDVSRVPVAPAGSLLLFLSFEVLLVEMVGASATPCSCTVFFTAAVAARFFATDLGAMRCNDWWLS
jgi:hypothetical protein